MPIGISKTDKSLPLNMDFRFAHIQLGESFGDNMLEARVWQEKGKYYFVPSRGTDVYEVDKELISFAFYFNKRLTSGLH